MRNPRNDTLGSKKASVRPERRPKAVVEGRVAQGSRERPSTSLRTTEDGEGYQPERTCILSRRTASRDDLIRSLAADGVETFYPTHSREQTAHLLELCDELGLIPTASSDYHGPTHKTFSRFGAYDTYGLADPQVPPRP